MLLSITEFNVSAKKLPCSFLSFGNVKAKWEPPLTVPFINQKQILPFCRDLLQFLGKP